MTKWKEGFDTTWDHCIIKENCSCPNLISIDIVHVLFACVLLDALDKRVDRRLHPYFLSIGILCRKTRILKRLECNGRCQVKQKHWTEWLNWNPNQASIIHCFVYFKNVRDVLIHEGKLKIQGAELNSKVLKSILILQG